MKLFKLVIQNFLSIRNATLDLADKGLVSIEGVNEDATGSDSNGSGKSSFINAILWCNYGSYGKDGGADDVVNSQARKDCFVYSEWREGDRVYGITRFRKHSKEKNSIRVELNGKDITKAGASEVQQQINEILGADEMVFRASCFAQQEDAVDIPAMTDKQLKELLEDCLPLDDLTPLHKRATDEVAAQQIVVRKLTEERDLKIWQIDHNKKELKEALDARLNYTKEVDEKNDRIDAQIKAKRVARGIALTMANKGTLEDDIAKLLAERKAITDTDIGMASYRHNEALKIVQKLQEQIADPNNTCSKCGQPVEDLDELVSRLKAKLAEAEATVADLRDKAKVTSYNRTIANGLDFRIEELRGQLAEVNRAADAVARLEAEIRLLEGQKAPAGDNPHQATVERLRGFVKAAIEGKEKYETQLKLAEQRLEVLKAVQLTYSPKGLRYHILEKVAPRLTADTNKYLKILTDGAITAVWSTVTKNASGDFKEKFSIEARMDGRNKFGLLSGGEKRKVRLACFFALQDLIASQASKNIELWCGDEIDNALDGAGMERLMGLLAEKTKSKSTILVISHNELREWIPNHATVVRKDGVSTITGYLNVD